MELLLKNQLVSSQIFLGALKSLPPSSREPKALQILDIFSLGLKREKSLSTVLSFVGIFEIVGELITGITSFEASILSSSCCLILSILQSLVAVENQIKSEIIFKSWRLLAIFAGIFSHEKDPIKICQPAPRAILNLCNFCLEHLQGSPCAPMALSSAKVFDLVYCLTTELFPALFQMADSLISHSSASNPGPPTSSKEFGVAEAEAEVCYFLSCVFITYSLLFHFSGEVWWNYFFLIFYPATHFPFSSPKICAPLSSWIPNELWNKIIPFMLRLGAQKNHSPIFISSVSQAFTQWFLTSPRVVQKEVAPSALFYLTTLWGASCAGNLQNDNLFHCLAALALCERFCDSTAWFWFVLQFSSNNSFFHSPTFCFRLQVQKFALSSPTKLPTSSFDLDVLIWALEVQVFWGVKWHYF